VSKEIVTAGSSQKAMAVMGPSEDLLNRVQEVTENLASVENFRLPRIKMTSDGAEVIEGEEPVTALEGVILHTKKTNVYYDKPYNPAVVEPPTCFSLDGEYPDASIEKPQHPSCKGCKMAEFGTNSMKSGKACRNLKPMFLLLSEGALIPKQLTVTPTGLKAANNYLINLASEGVQYRKVKTKIEFYKENPRDTYMKVRFKMGGKLAPEQVADVEYLRNNWLSVMNNQVIEQNEVQNEQAPIKEPAVETTGEF
jgi:hypothetical protein